MREHLRNIYHTILAVFCALLGEPEDEPATFNPKPTDRFIDGEWERWPSEIK